MLTNDDGSIEVLTAPGDFITVKEAEAAGFTPEFGQVTMKAENETALSGEEARRCSACSMRSGARRRAGGLYQRRHRGMIIIAATQAARTRAPGAAFFVF